MPQTYIYVIAFLITALVKFFFPQLSRLLTVIEYMWLGCIVLFGLLEFYLNYKYGKNAGQI
ncbi:hypothetical protein [Aristophania vespae]|uniref:hypothetical protein n=1 Tax=Aristophania vespae TaxID=2697033 RepID=UPI00235151E3|nr:hypothetical protein [Aristophania vespae]UMM64466.1 hypothetical protein DM15PD_14800 [Aristophania vespae]